MSLTNFPIKIVNVITDEVIYYDTKSDIEKHNSNRSNSKNY